ncbi:hypothetical protein [Veronia nyctiphanis]|uniref:hypothetical protein n=1 Tax=Veronia nyctiphanis TaxID=1278244 RepID=UPI001F351430|nr:hypothetical protein [Veronia nyctiphanis]
MGYRWATGISLLSCLMLSGNALAEMPAEPVEMKILDNRFRIDPTMSQVTFVIRRIDDTKSAVLVRPDGKKYYKSRHPDYVYWQQTPEMDIVSITSLCRALGRLSVRCRLTTKFKS